MPLFWKRKNKDRFVTLGLNEPLPERRAEQPATPAEERDASLEAPAGTSPVDTAPAAIAPPPLEPTPAGGAPTPPPANETQGITGSPRTAAATQVPSPATTSRAAGPVKPATAQKPVPSRSPFATSILGLDRSMEELQAQEAALEQAFAARFRRAVAATRESLSEKIDTVFQGRKQIDAALLDELEEALIAADIGVPTTLHILETVRRGIARNQINDIDALKQAIKSELLSILRAS